MDISIATFDQLDNHTLYQILKLRTDVFVVEQNCPYPELDNKDQNALHFYTEKDNEVIAYLRSYLKNDRMIAIGRIATHVNHRNKGLAKKLIQESIDQVDEKINTVFLQGQSHLQKFYESFGFKKISESYLEDGIPHIDMELVLKNC